LVEDKVFDRPTESAVFFHYSLLARPVAAASVLILTGCAGLPPDRGLPQVRTQLAARGLPALPAPDADGNPRLVDQILEQGPLGPDDAVRMALLANPRLRAEYAQLGFSAAEVYDAGRLANPTLSGAVLFTHTPGDLDRYDYGLSQNFLSLLLLPARKHLAQAEFERTQEQAGAAILQLCSEVEAAYYRLVTAQQVQELRRAVADAASTSAELAQRYYDAGNIAALDLELERAAAGQAEAQAVAAGNEAVTARAELGRLLGVPAGRQDWQVQNRLPAPLSKDDDAAALLALADRSRLDLAAKRREVETMQDALGLSRRYRLLGDVELGMAGERDDDGAHLLGPTLSVQLPLFNQNQGAVLRAQSQLECSQAGLDALQLDIGQSIRAAQARLSAQRDLTVRYRKEYLPVQESIVKHVQERTNAMLVGPFELIRARQQEYDVDQAYLEAVRDYWLARVELSRQVGAQLPAAQAVSLADTAGAAAGGP
jgi:outer membrane protein, heavy metal efflux system